jgi:hypothetical protein
LSKHAKPGSRSLRLTVGMGALTVGLVAASAGAAFSQEVPAQDRAGAVVAALPAPADQAAGYGDQGLTVPPELVPPPGHVLSSVFAARGVQVYQCKATVWTFLEPAATLTGRTVRPARPVTAVHFRGPSWQSAEDGSLVEGAAIANAPVAGSIPQLLLKASKNRGPGVFGDVTYVQRLATGGGAAPGTACTTEGVTTGIAYRAVYRFFVPTAKG